MKKAIVYRRVSTEQQQESGYGLQAQLADILRYASRESLTIVEDIADDCSGTTLDRPGLNRVRELLRSGVASVLVAHDSDRISRVPADYIALRNELAGLGIELHYARRGQVQLGTFGGDLFEDMQGRFAEEWRRKLIENCIAGKRSKVGSGQVIVAKRPPYGYKLQNGTLVIHEPEAAIIRLIFRLYVIDGLPQRAIAERLTAQQVPTRNDIYGGHKRAPRFRWNPGQIHKVLKNETYAGVWHWGKESRSGGNHTRHDPGTWIAVQVPAIIDRATWEIAQRKMSANRAAASRNSHHLYLMRGRLTCGNCGLPIYARHSSRDDHQYYYCSHRQQAGRTGEARDCDLPYFRADYIDGIIWQEIKSLLSDRGRLIELIEANIEAEEGSRPALEMELDEVRRKVARKQQQLDKLIRLYVEIDEQSAPEFIRVRAELQNELADLQRREAEINRELGGMEQKRSNILAVAADLAMFENRLPTSNEPFDLRLEWVQALNLTATLAVQDGQRWAHIRCCLGSFDVPIEPGTARNQYYNLHISFSIPLDSQPRLF